MPETVICADTNIWIPATLGLDAHLVETTESWFSPGFRMVAPSILHEEFCHVVKKYVRGRSVTPELALALTRGMLQSRIQILDDSVLHISALSLALEHPELSAYDAHFVAVAQQTGALLWTADKQLARLSEMIGVPTTLWSPP